MPVRALFVAERGTLGVAVVLASLVGAPVSAAPTRVEHHPYTLGLDVGSACEVDSRRVRVAVREVRVYEGDDIVFRVRPAFETADMDRLRAEGFEGHAVGHDWRPQLEHSLLWIGAFDGDRMVGFVNVAWDGGVHAFMLDTAVDLAYRHRGIGTRLVREAIDAVKAHGGIEWIHVDSDAELMEKLYFPAGFQATPAGLVNVAGG